jgi:ABC-2 type transport system permease protein
MPNTWLIVKREYWERVRTRSFLLSTLLLPAVVALLMVVPSEVAMLNRAHLKHLAVVCADHDFAQAVETQLSASDATSQSGTRYQITVITTTSEVTETELKRKIVAGDLDGYIWLDSGALASRKVSYVAREANDFIEIASLNSALKGAFVRRQLLSRGATNEEADRAVAALTVDTVTLDGGKERHAPTGPGRFISVIVLVMMLYMTLFLYGVAVMRSVLEEKASRIMEVLLSSATPRQVMGGKILGVGAAGLTQTLAWAVIGLLATSSGLAAKPFLWREIQIGPAAIIAFVVCFVLGYLLYSGLFAALGAMVNSEQEAQNWQLLVIAPLVVPVMLMTYVIRQPSSQVAVWMSLVPFFAPILMYLRIVVQMPPWWQIGLSIALTLATLWGVLVLCSRIWRVGILMYGKKPTLPEILKWAKHA